ncbi:hypothetical protein VNO77_31800 [Canavalia gladiata]|uniref:Cation/H+ exchanger domain-containing protein n=1 Tax=Canavalia gladiata TaxID=3824 RepID=A0AAN9KS66_CANGL
MEINANDTVFASITLLNVSDNHANYDVCLQTPPHILSDGIWGTHSTEGSPSRSSFPVHLLQVFVIYCMTWALEFPVKKLGLPLIISQMMAGLILGPTLHVLEKTKMMMFPYGSQDTLASIASLGYVLFVFEQGVKMDFSMIFRTGKKGWIIALLGLITPMLVSLVAENSLSSFLDQGNGLHKKGHEALVVLISQNITSFAVIASLLNDLQIINSELGRLTLSSALVGDMLSNILVYLASAFDKHRDLKGFGITFGYLFLVVIIIFFLYRPVMFWVIENTPERQEVKDIYLNIIMGFVFAMGWLATNVNQEVIFLPFIFGLATPSGAPLGSSLVQRSQFGIEFFLPFFLTTCAMKVNLSLLKSPSSAILVTVFLLFLGYLVKMVTYLVSSLYFKLPLKDALSLALLLNYKGVVQISMYTSALDKHDLHAEMFSVIIIIIMITSSIVYRLVKRLYDPSMKYAGYQQRNLFNLKPNSDLRVVVCIHKQHHTIPMMRALDLFYPTTEDPIIVDVLHLIELAGRSSPIFISHRMRKGAPSNVQNSYSENVILSFKLYEDENQGAISVYPYTAISPPALMQEDVCFLGLDKVASIIILPFHRKWSIEGKIEHEDKNISTINCKVMERAPCSVGILVSRGVHQKDSPLRLAMIFLGGNDDREALCLANRAARDSSINLVVYHITIKNNDENHDLDTVLDIAMLKDTKNEHSDLENVSYKEIEVESGLQTASILREMVDEHDFIIVGRRHGIECPQTKALQQWTEFTELGVIGDYLASADLDCKSSVLVVQQQQVSQ